MPYIATETVKMIRNRIKKEFPNVKFSITKEHYSTLNVCVLQSHMDFTKQPLHGQGHYPENLWKYNEESEKFLEKLEALINSCHEQKEIVYDYDYGSVPNYYLNIHIGKWDKPYVLKGVE
jgi:hypothetical protein